MPYPSPNGIMGNVFGTSDTHTAYVEISYKDIYGITDRLNFPPETKVTNFEIGMGDAGAMKGSVQLFDTFRQGLGDSSTSDVLEVMAKIISFSVGTGGFGQLFIRFGWVGVLHSPLYTCIVTDATYKLDDKGVAINISFICAGSEVSFKENKFSNNIEGVSASPKVAKIKRFFTPTLLGFPPATTPILPTHILLSLIGMYNGKWDNPPSNTIPPISEDIKFINCEELKNDTLAIYGGTANPSKFEPVEQFQCQGMTLSESLDSVFSSCIAFKDTKDKNFSKKYRWWIEKSTPVAGKTDELILIVLGTNPLDNSAMGIAKRNFYYRPGVNSNVISFNFKEAGSMAMYLSGFFSSKTIKGYYIDKRGDPKMKEADVIKNEDIYNNAQEIHNATKGSGRGGGSGFNKIPQKEDESFGPANYQEVNIAEGNWMDANKAGQALWRSYLSNVARQVQGTCDIEIVGDPKCLVTYGSSVSSATDTTVVKICDNVQVNVYNPNGTYNLTLSGQYLVLSITHTISFGKYTTKLNCIKNSTISSPVSQPSQEQTSKLVGLEYLTDNFQGGLKP